MVTSFDEIKIAEARIFQKALLAEGYSLSLVIINRAFPEWLKENGDSGSVSADPQNPTHKLWDYYRGLLLYYNRHEKAFEAFSIEVSKEAGVLRVPDFDQDVHDIASLQRVGQELVMRSQGAEK